jgi:hypothetical protein
MVRQLFSPTVRWSDSSIIRQLFLPVSIFKMAITIPQKIKLRICHNAKCWYKPVVSGRFGRLPHSLDYNHILFSVQQKLLRILSLIFCGIVMAILKMETGRNFAMSGINSEHHNLPTYEFFILNFCGIVTAILKILTTQNCSSNGDLSLCQIVCLLESYGKVETSYINVNNF